MSENIISSDPLFYDPNVPQGNVSSRVQSGIYDEEVVPESTCMAIRTSSQSVGVAINEQDVIIMIETPVEEDFQTLRQLVHQYDPKVILVSKGTNPSLIDSVKQNDQIQNEARNIHILKKTEFRDDISKQRILSLNIDGVPQDLVSNSDRELFVSSMVDFSKTQMIRACGALIGHMGDRDGTIRLKEATGKWFLRMDTDALQSLQVFNTEYHPSAAGIGGAKEGFSLFSLLNKARSTAGRKLLKKWFSRPTGDESILSDRMDHIAALRDARFTNVIRQIHNLMSSIKDGQNICSRISNLQSTCGDWISLRKTLATLLDLREMTRTITTDTKLRLLLAYQDITDGSELGRLLQLLDSVIDFAESKTTRRLTVRQGVDPSLDDLRRDYHGLGDILTQVATVQLNALPAHADLESLSTVYFPMIGYAVVIPRKPGIPVSAQIASLDGLEYQFDTETFIYFKSDITRGLDERLGDIHSHIVDRENACIRELEKHILNQRQKIVSAVNICSQIDCLIALTMCANEYRLERPKLIDTPGAIYITGGRHLLQELSVDTFVSNDTSICPDREGSIQLVTGPNGSGKSIYIKQVALICYLAHVGCFVPATGAIIGLLDGIFARIQTRESSAIAKSSFMLDLIQVATMLRYATQRTLLILDEFGKGTDPEDGAALLGASIEHIARTKSPCLITTHFSELLAPGILRTPQLQHITMSFVVRQDPEHEDQLVLLFRASQGSCATSFGSHCAKIAGVPQEIVQRAAQICYLQQTGQPITRLESAANNTRLLSYKKIYNKLIAYDEKTDPEQFISTIEL